MDEIREVSTAIELAHARALIREYAASLDTLAEMTHAQDLYRRLGFREIEPYYDNPIPGVRYLRLDL